MKRNGVFDPRNGVHWIIVAVLFGVGWMLYQYDNAAAMLYAVGVLAASVLKYFDFSTPDIRGESTENPEKAIKQWLNSNSRAQPFDYIKYPDTVHDDYFEKDVAGDRQLFYGMIGRAKEVNGVSPRQRIIWNVTENRKQRYDPKVPKSVPADDPFYNFRKSRDRVIDSEGHRKVERRSGTEINVNQWEGSDDDQ